MDQYVERIVRAAKIAAISGVAVAAVAACSSNGSNAPGGAPTRPAGGPSASSPASSPASASARARATGLRARDYVLPAGAAPAGFTARPASPRTAAEKAADRQINQCLGQSADDHHLDDADGPDFDRDVTATSVSTAAEVYAAAQVASDIRFVQNTANRDMIVRCNREVGAKFFATPDSNGVIGTIQSIVPLDASYLPHGVFGLRLVIQLALQGGSGVATAGGARPVAFAAPARSLPVYIDQLDLGAGQVEQQVTVSQANQPPDAVLERSVGMAANRLLDHQ